MRRIRVKALVVGMALAAVGASTLVAPPAQAVETVIPVIVSPADGAVLTDPGVVEVKVGATG